MRALVTGASGFVGRSLARRLLSEGTEVFSLVRRQSAGAPIIASLKSAGMQVIVFDTAAEVEEATRQLAPDTIFHLATHYLRDHVSADIGPLIEANITFGTRVLQGALSSSAGVVGAMSFFQFRVGAPTPNSLYSATKQAFLDISNYYRDIAGVDIRQVVLYDTYGTNDPRDKLVPLLLRAASSGGPLSLGAPEQPINLLHIDDVVTGLLAAASGDALPMMALRSANNVTVRELAQAVERATGRQLDVTFDDARAVSDLVNVSGDWPMPPGWLPRVSLAEGLRRSVDESTVG